MGLRRYSVVLGVTVACVAAVGLLPGAGCTFSNTNNPDTGWAPDDTGVDDAADTAPQLLPPTVFDTSSSQDLPADYSCLGKSDAGTADANVDETGYDGGTASPGQLIPTIIDLYSFNEGTRRLAGAGVDVYFHNTFAGGAADLAGIVTDDAGLAPTNLPASWEIAYRIVPKTDPNPSNALVPFYELDQLVPNVANQKMQFFGMTQETFQILALAVAHQSNYDIPAGTGIVASRIIDCQRRYVRNVSMELLDVTGGTASPVQFVSDCTQGPCIIYMNDNELPDLSRTSTARQGLIAMVNLPTNRKLRLIGHAYLDGDPGKEVGRRDLEIMEKAITTEFVEPR